MSTAAKLNSTCGLFIQAMRINDLLFKRMLFSDWIFQVRQFVFLLRY